MASRQETGYVHSIPVPIVYRKASKIAKKVKEGEGSLKNIIYSSKERNLKQIYALVVETFKRNDILDDLIQKSQLLVREPKFDLWLAKILMWNLLWGKKRFKRGCKPIETIMNYEKVFRELLEDCKDSNQPIQMHDTLKPRYVRVNTLKITTEEAVNNFIKEGWRLVPFLNKSNYKRFQERLNNLKSYEFIIDIHIPDLLIFPPKTRFYQHEAYKSGSIILQDKASCLPVHLLAPPPGSIVLDTCAAPGMKTTQLAALLENKGTLYAVEVNPNRESTLRQIVESASATCVKTILEDVLKVTDQACPDVEYILVDPSCSGSGITDRVELEKEDLSTRMERLKKLCNFQAKLLRHTMKSFPKAKRIVYSTCSLNSAENEDVVRQTLETSREFKLVNAREKLGTWNTKTSEVYPVLGNMCIFATPEEDKTNGFFVAVFERLQSGEKNPYLNYHLCKLFDKTSTGRKSKDKNTKIQGDNGNIEASFENSSKSQKNSHKEVDKNNEDEHCISKEQKKKKNKDKKLGRADNANTGTTSENPIEFGHTFKKEKKNKNNKFDSHKNENTDSFLENFIGEVSLNKETKKKKESLEEKRGNESFLENSTISKFNHTLDGDKKKKKIKLNKGEKNIDHKSFLEYSHSSEFSGASNNCKKSKKSDKILNPESKLLLSDLGERITNNEIEVKKIEKSKKRKRTSSHGESFKGLTYIEDDAQKNTHGIATSKAKKVKKT